MKSQSTQTFFRKIPKNRPTQEPVRIRRGVAALPTIKAVDNPNSPPHFRRMQQLQSIATKDFNNPTVGGSNYTGGEPTVVAHDFLDSPVAKAFESPRFSDASCISFNEVARSDMNSLMIFPTAEIARGPSQKADEEGAGLNPKMRPHYGPSVGNKPRRSFFKYKDLSAATSNFEFRIQKVPQVGDPGYQNYISRENLPISPITSNDQEARPANTEVSPRSSLDSKDRMSARQKGFQRKPFPFDTQKGKTLQLVRNQSTAVAQTSLCTIRKEFNIPEKIRLRRCQSLILDQPRNPNSTKYLKPIFNKLAEPEAVGRLPSRGQKFIPRRSFTLSNAHDSLQHKLGSSGEDLSIRQHRLTGFLEKSHLSSFAIATSHKAQPSSTSLAINCPDSQALSPYQQRLQHTKQVKYSGYFPIVVKQSKPKKPKMTDFERKIKGIHKRKQEGVDLQPKPMIFINGEFHCLLK